MKLKERVISPTPRFFRKIRTIGLALIAISGVILTAPVSMPAIIVSFAGYAGVAGGVMSAVSQLAVEDIVDPPVEPDIYWNINKPSS